MKKLSQTCACRPRPSTPRSTRPRPCARPPTPRTRRRPGPLGRRRAARLTGSSFFGHVPHFGGDVLARVLGRIQVVVASQCPPPAPHIVVAICSPSAIIAAAGAPALKWKVTPDDPEPLRVVIVLPGLRLLRGVCGWAEPCGRKATIARPPGSLSTRQSSRNVPLGSVSNSAADEQRHRKIGQDKVVKHRRTTQGHRPSPRTEARPHRHLPWECTSARTGAVDLQYTSSTRFQMRHQMGPERFFGVVAKTFNRPTIFLPPLRFLNPSLP